MEERVVTAILTIEHASAAFDATGLFVLLLVMCVVAAVAVLLRTIYFARALRPGSASNEQAAAFREGVDAFIAGEPTAQAFGPSGESRRWRTFGYRQAKRLGAEAALKLLVNAA